MSGQDPREGDSTQPGVTPHEGIPALVPKGGLFEGQVAVVGETRIEGAVQGSLRGPGALVIERGGRIEGLVECDRVLCSGQMVGPMRAESRIRLAAGTDLDGDIEAPVLEVDDDAIWNGKARIGRG